MEFTLTHFQRQQWSKNYKSHKKTLGSIGSSVADVASFRGPTSRPLLSPSHHKSDQEKQGQRETLGSSVADVTSFRGPTSQPLLSLSHHKSYQEKQRMREVVRKNRILLRKLFAIRERSPPRLGPLPKIACVKRRDYTEENKRISDRVANMRSSIRNADMERDYKKHEKLMRNITRSTLASAVPRKPKPKLCPFLLRVELEEQKKDVSLRNAARELLLEFYQREVPNWDPFEFTKIWRPGCHFFKVPTGIAITAQNTHQQGPWCDSLYFSPRCPPGPSLTYSSTNSSTYSSTYSSTLQQPQSGRRICKVDDVTGGALSQSHHKHRRLKRPGDATASAAAAASGKSKNRIMMNAILPPNILLVNFDLDMSDAEASHKNRRSFLPHHKGGRVDAAAAAVRTQKVTPYSTSTPVVDSSSIGCGVRSGEGANSVMMRGQLPEDDNIPSERPSQSVAESTDLETITEMQGEKYAGSQYSTSSACVSRSRSFSLSQFSKSSRQGSKTFSRRKSNFFPENPDDQNLRAKLDISQSWVTNYLQRICTEVTDQLENVDVAQDTAQEFLQQLYEKTCNSWYQSGLKSPSLVFDDDISPPPSPEHLAQKTIQEIIHKVLAQS